MTSAEIKACLITNPRSGRGEIDLSAVVPLLEAHGWEVTVRRKLHGNHARDLAREAAEAGYDVVVGCGGDGTMSEIVNGLVGTDVTVGVLPGGTANLWARELGISPRLRIATRQLLSAGRYRIDVGRVTINGRRSRHFLLMAGLGIDGMVMGRVSRPLKRRFGPLAVALAAAQTLPTYRPVQIRAELDGAHWQGRVSQVVISNTRNYGGFAELAPSAFIDDGLLDVALITATSPISVGRQLASLLLRHRPDPRTTKTFQVAALSIHTANALPLQLDGGAMRPKKKDKPKGHTVEYSFGLIPRGISVLVPHSYDGTLFEHGVLLEPLVHQAQRQIEAEDDPTGNTDHEDQAEKVQKRLMQVLAIGDGSFTAVRTKSGKIVRVLVDQDTVYVHGPGTPLNGVDQLASLSEGMVVRVKGKKNHDSNAIQAQQIILPPVE